jgi:hypothetical protein
VLEAKKEKPKPETGTPEPERKKEIACRSGKRRNKSRNKFEPSVLTLTKSGFLERKKKKYTWNSSNVSFSLWDSSVLQQITMLSVTV